MIANLTSMAISKTKKLKPAVYSDRLILFIDFLGFSEIVCRTESDPDELRRLLAAMDRLGQIGDATFLKSQKVTQFSDSVVVSYAITERSAVFHLLNAIALCVIDLAHMGYLVRGGVTSGPLLHSSQRLVGPAMIKAYRLESKVAQVPRVVIDKNLLAIARRHRDAMHTPAEEEEYASHFMTKDKDGQYFFDYVSFQSVVAISGGDADLYPDYLDRIRRHLKAGFAHRDLNCRAKYLWLHRQYVDAIKLMRSLPPDHAFRIREHEIHATVSALRTMNKKAKKIQAKAQKAKLPVVALS